MAKEICLYRGKERIQHGNVLCIPCEDFLLLLKPDNYNFFDSNQSPE